LLGADDDGPFAVLLGGTPKGGLAVAAATLVAFGAALGGWASARERYGATRPKDWAEREARVEKHPLVRLASWAGTVPVSLGASVGSVLARMTSEVDEHVFDFVPRAIAAVAGAGGWVATAAERDITLRVGARVASFRWTPSRRVVFVLVVFAVMVVVGSFVMSARSR
jgi:hypothetical protein